MLPHSSTRSICLIAVIAAFVTGCNEASDITGHTSPARVSTRNASMGGASVVRVADVEQLYAAVNNPVYAGTTLLLDPGTYVLSATDASGAVRPNGGRLELQQDMSMSGVPHDRGAVVIAAASLPTSSFPTPFGRTGVIRIGRGHNDVEWLTIEGNPLAASAINTDIGSTADAWVRVAHVVAGNSARGVDVRNVGAALAGRRLHAEITDSEFFRGVQGIRIANLAGAHGGQITVVMSGNRAYENVLGCLLANNQSNFATIHIRSNGDRFYDNGFGCRISGGIAPSGVQFSSSTTLEARGTAFVNNTRTEFFNNMGPDFGTNYAGLLVLGGEVLSPTATASRNSVTVRLVGCRVAGNRRADFEAWGAYSSDPSTVAGVDNHVTIELQGISKQIDVVGAASAPADPTATNTLTVVR